MSWEENLVRMVPTDYYCTCLDWKRQLSPVWEIGILERSEAGVLFRSRISEDNGPRYIAQAGKKTVHTCSSNAHCPQVIWASHRYHCWWLLLIRLF